MAISSLSVVPVVTVPANRRLTSGSGRSGGQLSLHSVEPVAGGWVSVRGGGVQGSGGAGGRGGGRWSLGCLPGDSSDDKKDRFRSMLAHIIKLSLLTPFGILAEEACRNFQDKGRIKLGAKIMDVVEKKLIEKALICIWKSSRESRIRLREDVAFLTKLLFTWILYSVALFQKKGLIWRKGELLIWRKGGSGYEEVVDAKGSGIGEAFSAGKGTAKR